MKRGYFLLAVFLFILIPFALSLESLITIETAPDNNVSIYVYKMADNNELKSFEVPSDSTGKATATITSDYSERIGISVISRKDGKIVYMNKTESLVLGSPMNIKLVAEEPKPMQIVNITAENTSATSNITNETSSEEQAEEENKTLVENQSSNEITGSSISFSGIKPKIEKIFSKTALYIILGIAVLGLVVFLLFKFAPSMESLRLRKAEFADYHKQQAKEKMTDREIEKAEKKIQEAMAEIEAIKNRKNQIKDAEKNFEEAKKQLEKLKGEKL